MPKVMVKINPDGSRETRQVPRRGEPTFEDIKGFLGGYYERVQMRYEGRIRYAYVDEEGLIKGLPFNEEVTRNLDGHFKNYAGMIVGPAIVVMEA